MDYVITFSDVMAGVITLGLGVITFFIKGWFNNLKSSTEEIKKQIRENDEKVNKRIDKLEEETDRDIANIKQELNPWTDPHIRQWRRFLCTVKDP